MCYPGRSIQTSFTLPEVSFVSYIFQSLRTEECSGSRTHCWSVCMFHYVPQEDVHTGRLRQLLHLARLWILQYYQMVMSPSLLSVSVFNWPIRSCHLLWILTFFDSWGLPHCNVWAFGRKELACWTTFVGSLPLAALCKAPQILDSLYAVQEGSSQFVALGVAIVADRKKSGSWRNWTTFRTLVRRPQWART